MITTTGRPMVLAMDDASRSGEARRGASAMAERLGFDETGRGKVAIVASEAATNLVKHAQGGVIVIQGLEEGTIGGVEILALDRGPGMVDVDRCLSDGFSTQGTSGNGLGAMARLSDRFDIHSLPGNGTATLARLWSTPTPSGLEFGAVSLPLAGEDACGDHWAIAEVEERTLVLVVDGLGHGPQAADAARDAVQVFRERAALLGPSEIIRAAHAALGSTRGASLAIAELSAQRHELRFAGVGNISGSILGPNAERTLSMVSHNGTVGHTIRKIQEFTYPWLPGSLLVMHSDGLGSQWRLNHYPGLASRHPGLVAGTLYRDYKRERDDVTVVAVREGSAGDR
ncbi:MAG: anti-sigma regulatory factor [Isosphaeraceae bacterium]